MTLRHLAEPGDVFRTRTQRMYVVLSRMNSGRAGEYVSIMLLRGWPQPGAIVKWPEWYTRNDKLIVHLDRDV